MRKRLSIGALAALTLLLVVTVGEASSRSEPVRAVEYVVVFDESATAAQARAAIRASGGRILRVNGKLGVATVISTNPRFSSAVAGKAALVGAARNAPIGALSPELRPKRSAERALAERELSAYLGAGQEPDDRVDEPLWHLQWNMRMIDATAFTAHRIQQGDSRVLVGIIDTGIDGSHPDLAPNFNRELSRNFTTDIPLIDGPCEEEPDRSCSDPADVDEAGHGTHVAGIVAAARNGLGITGVAPTVTLVNVRALQDSGFVFLPATVDALTYAADAGIDVVNMSFFTDPWLFACRANPADSPEEQQEQRTIIEAIQRALLYAHQRGVTLVSALGNDHLDLGNPTVDTTSPNFPPGRAKRRTIDNNTCLHLPAEGPNVINASALGPSEQKADYSNYGVEQTDLSAPGGWFRDFFGMPEHRTDPNQILSTYPEALLREAELIDEDGVPLNPAVVRDCRAAVCAYYRYLQGTSMAAPHVAGVAALVVSEYGTPDASGLGMDPGRVESILKATARDHPCPEPRLFSYEQVGRPADFNAFCEGTPEFNGFYGHGIVNALAAVGGFPREDPGEDDD